MFDKQHTINDVTEYETVLATDDSKQYVFVTSNKVIIGSDDSIFNEEFVTYQDYLGDKVYRRIP
jgi:hypothetical protein